MSEREDARRLLRELLPELLHEALGPGPANGNGTASGHGANGHAPNGQGASGHGPNGHGANGHAAGGHGAAPPVPLVPAPPVAAVLRPSSWTAPPAPGEVIGDAPPVRGDASRDAAPHGESPPHRPPPPAPGARRAPAPPAPASPTPPAPPAPTAPAAPRADGVRAAAGTEWVALDSDDDLDRFVRSLLARFENPRDRMAIRAGALRFALRRPAAAGAHDGGDGAGVHRVQRGAVTERTVKAAADAGARLVLAPGAVLTPLARERARALRVEIERERRC